MNPFELLGISPCLECSAEELAQQFDERGKACHPDKGGADQAFAQLRAAYELLNSPAGRIKAALATLTSENDARGVIPGDVMNLFSEVAGVLEDVNVILRERVEARSGLTRAMVDAKIPALKFRVEEAMSKVLGVEEFLIGRFAEFDQKGWEVSAEAMAEVSRGLVFIEKWKSQLQGATGKLFEALLGGTS